jgi:hypothetical protein
LIVAPRWGYDAPKILSYAIGSFCPTSANGLQHAGSPGYLPLTAWPRLRAGTVITRNARCAPSPRALYPNLAIDPLALRGRNGAVTVGFSSGPGVERPVVVGSGSNGAAGAIGSTTLFARNDLPYEITVAGGGLYEPELGPRDGCSRAYRPNAKHAAMAQ